MSDTMSNGKNAPGKLWFSAGLWLLFLGPFFFLSYGFANQLAAQNAGVSSIVFDWERHIPFVPWTIIPYWIIDALYALSLFVCTTRLELHRHALRLLSAQIVAVICFILFPLGFSFERPETSGVSGWMFNALTQFDQPYNQAPSLHIALLVILWVLYIRHLPKYLIWPFHLLAAMIGISVLTTYQHHFIDIPTGALLGWLCVWAWPVQGQSIFNSARLTRDPRRWKLAGFYLGGSVLITVLALWMQGGALWLLWPAVSLLLVALNYAYFGSAGFQKDESGQLSLAAKWLYFPYLIGAFINSRLWTRNEPKAVAIYDGIHLGRLPTRRDINQAEYDAIVDLTAEFAKPRSSVGWHALPQLDLLIPSKEDLIKAAELIKSLEKKFSDNSGKILVACALGYSRSALAIISWLLLTGRVSEVDDAIALIKQLRPSIVINEPARASLHSLMEY